MPEIAEAQALLAALAETDEVKARPRSDSDWSQLHVALWQRTVGRARHWGAGNDGSVRRGPRVGTATRTRRNGCRLTSACGQAAI